MYRRHTSVLAIVVLLSLGLTAATALSQSKPNTTSTPKKSPSVAARTVPTIKCTDPDSMVACKSFKQLVDARDKDLMDSLTGDKDIGEKHFAYVCLWPKQDTFKIVEFYEPPSAEFQPYSPPVEAKGLSVIANGQAAFPYAKEKPVMQLLDAQEKWFKDHDDFSRITSGGFTWTHGKKAFWPTTCLITENGDGLCLRGTVVPMKTVPSKAHTSGLPTSIKRTMTNLQR
jgi:hypothetical protein